jgi:hypothetical protein
MQVIRYSVEQSFDAYSWQTVERKARFIAQVMRGRIDVRDMEDVGDTALSSAEANALASGDPLVLQKSTADADLARLERMSRAHRRNLSAVTCGSTTPTPRSPTGRRPRPPSGTG